MTYIHICKRRRTLAWVAHTIRLMGTTYPRREKRKQQSREALIKAALHLFATKGFEETTLDDIANLADLHVQTLYRHFPTKNDLAVAIDRAFLHQFRKVFAERGDVDTLTFWRGWVQGMTREIVKHGKQYRKTVLNLHTVPTISTTYLETWFAYEETLAEGIAADLHMSPEDPLPQLIACALWGGQRHAIRRWILAGGEGDLAAASLGVVDAVCARFGELAQAS